MERRGHRHWHLYWKLIIIIKEKFSPSMECSDMGIDTSICKYSEMCAVCSVWVRESFVSTPKWESFVSTPKCVLCVVTERVTWRNRVFYFYVIYYLLLFFFFFDQKTWDATGHPSPHTLYPLQIFFFLFFTRYQKTWDATGHPSPHQDCFPQGLEASWGSDRIGTRSWGRFLGSV